LQANVHIDFKFNADVSFTAPAAVIILKQYLRTIVQQLNKQQHSDEDADRSKELANQAETLKGLETILEFRCKKAPVSNSSTDCSTKGKAVTQLFDETMDDDEVLLFLIREFDKDKTGRISKGVLHEMQKQGEHAEIAKALLRAWECDKDELQDALAHLDEKEFGRYKMERAAGQAVAGEKAFDFGASVDAVLNDALKSQRAIVTNGALKTAQKASRTDLEKLIKSINEAGTDRLVLALKDLAKEMPRDEGELDFMGLKTAVRKIPRVAAQRLEWVREMGLEAAMARHLPPGSLTDGLKGIKAIDNADLEEFQDSVLQAFFADVNHMFKAAVMKTRETNGSTSAAEANSKFTDGFFQGNFASLKDFHAGAEETLQLGYPNPNIDKGILLEHTAHHSVTGLFVTPNYRISTCLLVEYYWAMIESNPEEKGVIDVKVDTLALNWIVKLWDDRVHGNMPTAHTQAAEDGVNSSVNEDQLLFPGEVGDSFLETFVMVSTEALVDASDSHKTTVEECKNALEKAAKETLATEEEQARGFVVLNHAECMAWMTKRTSMLPTDPSAATGVTQQAAIPCEPLVVGVVLPMCQPRAEANLEALRAAVAAAAGTAAATVSVKCCKTWTYCEDAGIDELRKRLGEMSLKEIRKEAIDKKWGIAENSASSATHESLCDQATDFFVRTELQADFIASLDNAVDSHLDVVLEAWKLCDDPPMISGQLLTKEQKRAIASSALISRKRWKQVEQWVGLFRGRIKGRTRLGRKKLIEREKEKIQRCHLTEGEVLALHIYTGPEFVPINALCRNFCKQNSLTILRGDGLTPRNTLSTTLFCISSGIKKLGQHTHLPANRKVYRGLGSMVLPQQFWIAHGTPPWRGGVERAFMSTTAEMSVAIFYAKGRGTVAEIGVGRIQIGGDVSFLSMVSW
jgi:hypothetical protein